MTMDLAKQHIDVGVYTNRTQPMLSFYQSQVGLAFEQMLKLGGGVQQHRHAMNGSVLKVNSVRDPMPPVARAGYRALWVASTEELEPLTLHDPDDNEVRLMPSGHTGVNGIALVLSVSNAKRYHDFYGRVLRLEPAGKSAYRCGDSLLAFEETRGAARNPPLQGTGIRYFTIQVRDVDREHATAIDRGATEGLAPVTLGTFARISFVRDPDGNWIELSQQAELTGPLSGQ